MKGQIFFLLTTSYQEKDNMTLAFTVSELTLLQKLPNVKYRLTFTAMSDFFAAQNQSVV